MENTRPTVKVHLKVHNEQQWYGIIRELNQMLGKDWKGQKHVRRKFSKTTMPLTIWFEVPDEKIASYLKLKYSG